MLSVNEEEVLDVAVSVYPNPVSEYINITSIKTIDSIEVYNLLGKRVIQTEQTSRVKVNQLSDGIYLLKVFVDGRSVTKKIVIK